MTLNSVHNSGVTDSRSRFSLGTIGEIALERGGSESNGARAGASLAPSGALGICPDEKDEQLYEAEVI